MSNEFVMVPRSMLYDACGPSDLCSPEGFRLRERYRVEACKAICEIMAKPSEQHQGEPVACIDTEPFLGLLEALRSKIGYAIQFPVNSGAFKTAISDVLATIASLEKCIALVAKHTHADPGEVERLRTELTRMHEANWKASRFGIKLQAKLAERDALLRAVPAMPTSVDRRPYDDADPEGYLEGDGDWCDNNRATVAWLIENHAAIRAALSASAEPSAPKCGNCGASTGQACNDKGCGYLEAGNGERHQKHCLLLDPEEPEAECNCGAEPKCCEPSAPDCATCNDEGAVGNVLDTVPCPDCAAAPPAERDEQLRQANESVRIFMEWAYAESNNRIRTYEVMHEVKRLFDFVSKYGKYPADIASRAAEKVEAYLSLGYLTPKAPDSAITLPPELAEKLVSCFDNIALKPVEPSAPVQRDERAAFESAYPGLTGCCRWDEGKQEYKSGEKGLGWQDGLKATEWLAVWKARAALERKP